MCEDKKKEDRETMERDESLRRATWKRFAKVFEDPRTPSRSQRHISSSNSNRSRSISLLLSRSNGCSRYLLLL